MFPRCNIKLCLHGPFPASPAPRREAWVTSFCVTSARGSAPAAFWRRLSDNVGASPDGDTHCKRKCLVWLLSCPHRSPHSSHLLWEADRLEKADFVRPANHSRLSCMLAKALRSLTSRRMSCGGINLSPRFPIRTSDSLPKAALKSKPETLHTQLRKDRGGQCFLRHV